MAILKKGSRRIVVDGQALRWRVRHRPTYHQGLCQSSILLAVSSDKVNGSTLIATLPQLHPSNYFGESAVPVFPSQVATLIEKAITMGWEPEKQGKSFVLKLS